MIKYEDIFQRNIGLISKEQQENIRKARVLICGLGGMGGVAAEVLVRLGIGNLKIVDHDIYDVVNLNRQMYSNVETVGRPKVEVLKENFLKINPFLKIESIHEPISLDNIDNIIKDVDVVINGMDEFLPSIILERIAHKKGIPIVDSWLTPFASVFVIKSQDPHWEEYLKLDTLNKDILSITKEDVESNVRKELLHTLSFFNPFLYVDKCLVEKIIKKEIPRPSLSIVVFMSGTLMANEVFKYICGYETTDFKGIIYDQYSHKIKKI